MRQQLRTELLGKVGRIFVKKKEELINIGTITSFKPTKPRKSCHDCWFDWSTTTEFKPTKPLGCQIHSDQPSKCEFYSEDKPNEDILAKFQDFLLEGRILKKGW